MNAAADKAFRSKLEVLLGERKGAEQNRAVRLKEIESILRNTTGLVGTVDPSILKPIVDKAVDDALDDYVPPGWDPIIERIEQAEQDAEQAKNNALNALSQANAAHDYADEQVSLVYDEIAALQLLAGEIDGRVTGVRDDLEEATDQIALDLQAALDEANNYTDSGFTSYNTTIQGQFDAFAGQIDQLTAALTSTNLIQNGLFALGTTGWTLTDATVLARADLTGLGAAAPHPNLAQLAAAPAASISTDLNAFAVTANDRVQFRFMAAATSVRTITVTLAWEDGAGDPIGTPAVETLTISPANSWKVYSKQVDPPDAAVGATLTISKAAGGAAALITGIEVSTVNVALEARVTAIEAAYVTETDVTAMVTSAVNARYNDAAALVTAEATARANADIAIGNRITLVEVKNGTQDAAIGSQATAIAEAEGAIAQLDESVAATFGAAELISDPVFSRDFTKWPSGNLGSIVLRSATPGNMAYGMPAKKALEIPPGAEGSWRQRQALPADVTPGEVLDYSAQYRRTTGSTVPRLAVNFYDSTGAEIITGRFRANLTDSAADGIWLPFAASLTVPATAIQARAFVEKNPDDPGTVRSLVTNISLRRRQALDFITQASISTLTQAYSDVDEAFAAYKLELSAIFNDPDTGFGALAGQISDRYTKAETDSAISSARNEYRSALYKTAGGLINDPYLASSGWGRWSGQGTLTWTDNEIYDTGRTWRFVVTATQQDGLLINDSPDTIWPGQQNADAYVIEVEYDFVSGNLNGAGVMLRWANTAGVSYDGARKTLRDMTSGTYSYGKKVARGVFRKPDNFTGTFASHDLYVFANWGSLPPMAAKTIKFHRVNIRVATAEELGSGEVMAEVQATLTENYFTKAQTNQAIANFDMNLYASLGSAWAQVKQSATAIAGLNGNVARFRNVATVDGELVAAGIEAVAFNNVGGATGSLLKLIGDNVIAEGTMSTNALVVGLGGNLLMDPSFDDGFAANWIAAGNLPAAQRIIDLRPAGQSYAHPGWPTLMIRQTTGYADGNRFGQIQQRPSSNGAGARYPGVPITGGKTYIASAYFRTLRCEAQLQIYFFDANGAQLSAPATARSQYNVGAAAKPDAWDRPYIKAVAPADAAYASIAFLKRDTLSGQSDSYLFIWKPQLEEVHAKASGPKAWSPGGTTYINGGRLFSKSIQTRQLDTDDLAVSGLALFNGTLKSLNFDAAAGTGWRITNAGQMVMPDASVTNAKIGNFIQSNNFISGEGGRGWKIDKSGAAEFNTIKIRRQIAIASGTLAVSSKDLRVIPPENGYNNIAYGPIFRVFAVTAIPIDAWGGTEKTYLAVGGLRRAADGGDATVSTSNATGNELWGYVATVAPLTRWSGVQRLRIIFDFYAQGLTGISAHTIHWTLYEVS